ncbi:sugar transferase [Hydrogenophilus hirschii]
MSQSLLIRICDRLLAAFGLVVSAPLLVVLILVSWWDTGSPLFLQTRVGRFGRPFTLIKLRTMHPGTPQVATHLAPKAAVTRWGKWLRATKLDELPQLINVLKGDMSLVGPRPSLTTQTELIEARRRLEVLNAWPGVTGLAQLSGVDMSRPQLLAAVDARMLADLDLKAYLRYLLFTLLRRRMDIMINTTHISG